MIIRSQQDFWSGLMFIFVGAAFSGGATLYSFGSSANPGPGYFPFGLGVLLAVIGLVVVVQALTITTQDGEKVGAFAWRPLVVILASAVAFGALLPRLGMIVSLPILVLVSSIASRDHSGRDSVLCALVVTAFSWLIFIKGLGLRIPVWPPMFVQAAG